MNARMLTVAVLVAVTLSGCAGAGETRALSASAGAVLAPVKTPHALRVAVVSFEDVRPDKTAIGRYQHYMETRVDQLVPESGSAAEQITAFVTDYLARAGFQVTRVQTNGAVPPDSANVVLTGQIESYWNEAVTRFFRTELLAKNRLVLRASNVSTGSTLRTSVAGEATTTVVCFCLTDLETLNNTALAQSLSRFLDEVTVSAHTLTPRR